MSANIAHRHLNNVENERGDLVGITDGPDLLGLICDLSATHTVVQCPGCNTRFSIESEAIASVSRPRFHCSRCDALFVINNNSASRSVTARPSIQEAPKPAAPSLIEDAPLTSNDFSIGHQNEQEDHEPEVIDHKPLLTSTPEPRLPAAEPQVTLKSAPPTARQWDLGLGLPNSKPANADGNTQTTNARSRVRASNGFSLKGAAGQWGSVITLLSPAAATLALLAFVAAIVSLNPSIGSFSLGLIPSFLQPETPKIPPPGVVVNNSKFEMIRLDSGDTVPVVFGKILNASDATLRDVKVQGMGFDSQGRLLISSVVPLKNGLNNENISGLSIDSIKKLQQDAAQKGSTLNPGDEVSFSVALLADGNKALADGLRYFSARVYSVR